MKYSGNKKMTCQQAQLLIAPHIADERNLTTEERLAFENHLQNCHECAREYEESKWVIDLVKEYWPEKPRNCILLERANRQLNHRPMTVEERWKDFCRRCPDLAENTEKPKSIQLFLRVGAVAACLVIGVLTWMVFSNYSKPQTSSQGSSSQQVAFVPKHSVKVELVTSTGNIPFSSNQQITSAGQLKTLLVNGKHQMKMNTNTILRIEPLVENSNIGCLVKLASGQIYTHVQHDGNPFIVDTFHGQAVITGTTFDIKATEDSTTLVVIEGTVRLESQEGVVNVAAGQKSDIVGQSAPSIPLSCNAAELTAWATGYKPEPILAQFKSNTSLFEFPLSLRKEPVVLEASDYDHWVEQKRSWFKQEFPWIFQLKDALAKEGIIVDYPELLTRTDDIWQFACLDVSSARFSIIDPNSLINTASNYGFDRLWLLENVPATKYALEKPVLSKNSSTDLAAFERWLEYLDETKQLIPPTPIYSFHASKYLANTRSLIWFAVRDGRYDLTDKEHTEVLTLLQEEVTAACNCQNEVLYPEDEPQPKLVCGGICQKPVDNIVGYIEKMKAFEERIAGYEIGTCILRKEEMYE